MALKKATKIYASGVLFASIVAMAAMFVNEHYGGPVMLYALLFGTVFNFLDTDQRFSPGIAFTATHILRIGVALLGARITLGEVAALGAPTVMLVICGVIITIGMGTVIARWFGLGKSHAIISSGSVAICGASAALALSAVLPRDEHRERHVIITIIGVTTLSTIAMVLYPLITQTLNLTDQQAGIFIGATIHDVAQVVGAGYIISDQAGETATIVKLMRVSCLIPVIFSLGMVYRMRPDGQSLSETKTPLLPLFLIGFIALMIANSVGIIPPPVSAGLGEASRYGLIMAVAALGMKTSLRDIAKIGPGPIIVLTLQTMLLALFGLGSVLLIAHLL